MHRLVTGVLVVAASVLGVASTQAQSGGTGSPQSYLWALTHNTPAEQEAQRKMRSAREAAEPSPTRQRGRHHGGDASSN